MLSICGICAVLFELKFELLPFKMCYIIVEHPVVHI